MLFKGDSMLYNCDKLCVCVTQIYIGHALVFFGLAIFHQTLKLQKLIHFGGFQSLEVREKIEEIVKFLYLVVLNVIISQLFINS